MRHVIINSMDKVNTNESVIYRLGTAMDSEEIIKLQWLCHKENPDFYYPFLKEDDDLIFKPENCSIALHNSKLISVGYTDMESDDFKEIASRAKLSWTDGGLIGAITLKKYRRLGIATNNVLRAIKILEHKKKDYVCTVTHPENFSKKICENFGLKQIGEPYIPCENHAPRIFWVADIKTVLSCASEELQEL